MANIFYDRSGKAHVIGTKKKDESRSSPDKSKSNKPSKFGSKKKHHDRPSESRQEGRPEGRFATEGSQHKKHKEQKEHKAHKEKKSFKGGKHRNDRPDGKGHRGFQDKNKDRKHHKKRSFGGEPPRGSFAQHKKKNRERAPHPDWKSFKGVIDKNKRGSAFLVLDRADMEDIFIPRYYVDQLFHGDRVEALISDRGEIEDLKVLQHRFKEIFGRVHLEEQYHGGTRAKSKGRTGYLIYERKKVKEEVFLPNIPPQVKEGDWVKAEMVFSEEGKAAPLANIIQVIGPELPAIYDIQMVAGEYNLKEHHSFDAVKQAESYTLDLDDPTRTDLRHIPFITIDGERARDFDDAVYVERIGEGYRLWVAIADVSHYVKEGTPLDREAFERGTSVYFPERAFHMLPRALSEELCSLKPKVPRLAMATSIDYAADGTKGEIKIYNAIIESRRRSTYTEIEAEKNDPKHADLFALYRILRKFRTERGSIDFDFPEAEIILDEKTGEPSDIVIRERQDAHRLIEEMMIAANESVTEWMLARKLPFVYRIHEEPSPESMIKFRKLARMMGVALADKGGTPKPKVLAEFVRSLVGHPAEPILANALLRSMKQAIYTATHNEHYGLASEGYTHFTSPIRRYPDLVVHRLLRAALAKESPGDEETLEQIAEHCSYRERIASEAERESIRFKQVRLMAKHVGEEFEGKVTGLMDRGMFVQLTHPYCEGMVPVDSMDDDWYEFQEDRMILVGRKKKRSFTIGMPVKIQVIRVDMDARQVEFHLVDEPTKT